MAARRYFIPKAVTLPYRLQLRHPLTLRLARAASAATAPLARARGGVAGGLARRPAHLPRLAGGGLVLWRSGRRRVLDLGAPRRLVGGALGRRAEGAHVEKLLVPVGALDCSKGQEAPNLRRV